MSTPLGVQAVWRQLVDLIGRKRAPATEAAIERLIAIRGEVPSPVRAATARMLEFAQPPASLVRFFADDDLAIAAPVLRAALLAPDEWIAMLPAMPSTSRSLLRNRRDLSPEVRRALESFGSVDFVLSGAVATMEEAELAAPDPVEASSAFIWHAEESAPEPAADPFVLPREQSFVSLAEAARTIPIVAEAMRLARADAPKALITAESAGPFEISDLVARIDAFHRARSDQPALPFVEADLHAAPVGAFRFETDAQGVVRWVGGVAREPLIGLSLDLSTAPAGVRTDGIAGGAFRRRAPFTDARLTVDGQSDAAGTWRISAVPAFDPASGRFTGYRGSARRPRVDEQAEPIRRAPQPVADSLRQLVHELRTPTNAIVGFAEMIERQMLGPVPQPYREQAAVIRSQTRDLIGAIDDIDIAARIDAGALDIRNAHVVLSPILTRIADDLRPLAELRRATLSVDASANLALEGDDRAIERLLSRLLATVLSATAPGEAIAIRAGEDGRGTVSLRIDRPRGLPIDLDAADAETEAAAPGGPLLGTGFALRLAHNLARELGGGLDLGPTRLTLRLPAAVDRPVEQATNL